MWPTLEMAMHGRQVQVAATDDGVIAVQRDVIVDRERGIATEVEKVTMAVDLGDGNIAVAEQQRVTGVRLLDPDPVCGKLLPTACCVRIKCTCVYLYHVSALLPKLLFLQPPRQPPMQPPRQPYPVAPPNYGTTRRPTPIIDYGKQCTVWCCMYM